ncbi:hypothetical protein NL676_024778 [Syzygium grande]|nr:hypothetical protein NL676_024778 [Syzygium grande]
MVTVKIRGKDLRRDKRILRGPFIWGRLRLGHDLGVGRYGGRVATGSLAILGWTLENHMPFYAVKGLLEMVFGSNEEHKSGAAQPRVHAALHASDEDGGGAGGRNRVKGEPKEKHFLDAIRVSVMVIEPEVNHFHFSGNFSNSVPIAG